MAAALRYFPLFSDASDEQIESVAKFFQKYDVKASEKIYEEGDKADKMFFLYTGKIVLTSEDELGLIMELTRIVDIGSIIGDELLFDLNKKRMCTVTALEDSIIFSINKKGFDKLAHVLPELAENIILSALQREKLRDLAERYPVFRSISKKRQHQLSTICQISRFQPGKTIIKRGDPNTVGRKFYIVAGGTASVYLDGSIIRTLKEGDYFGEVALVSDKPPSATVKVIGQQDCFCLTISADDFKALFVTEPSVLAEFNIRHRGHETPFEHVLNHPKARKSFLKYCDKEFARENVEFWKAVEDYENIGKRKERKSVIRALNISVRAVKKQKEKLMAKKATAIIEKWVVDNAEEEVSMEGIVKEEILKRYKDEDFSYDMFAEAKKLVFTIMEGDNYKRYKESDEFKELLKEIGEYE